MQKGKKTRAWLKKNEKKATTTTIAASLKEGDESAELA